MTIGVLCLGGAGLYQLNLPGGGAIKQAGPTETVVQPQTAARAEAAGTRSSAVLVKAVEKPGQRVGRVVTGAVSPAPLRIGSSRRGRPSATEEWVQVVGSWVNMRRGPAGSTQRVTSYRRNTHLQLLETRGEWLKVRHPESDSVGWMFGKYLRKSPPPREDIAERNGRSPG